MITFREDFGRGLRETPGKPADAIRALIIFGRNRAFLAS
jgi:hypothetical protein